jgi:hypothetical protein
MTKKGERRERVRVGPLSVRSRLVGSSSSRPDSSLGWVNVKAQAQAQAQRNPVSPVVDGRTRCEVRLPVRPFRRLLPRQGPLGRPTYVAALPDVSIAFLPSFGLQSRTHGSVTRLMTVRPCKHLHFRTYV